MKQKSDMQQESSQLFKIGEPVRTLFLANDKCIEETKKTYASAIKQGRFKVVKLPYLKEPNEK